MLYQEMVQREMVYFARFGVPYTKSWNTYPTSIGLLTTNVTVVNSYHSEMCKFWNDNKLPIFINWVSYTATMWLNYCGVKHHKPNQTKPNQTINWVSNIFNMISIFFYNTVAQCEKFQRFLLIWFNRRLLHTYKRWYALSGDGAAWNGVFRSLWSTVHQKLEHLSNKHWSTYHKCYGCQFVSFWNVQICVRT
jgi:hypothetical protein